jgi:hypothetical protein
LKLNGTIKASVNLPDDLHRQLKVKSVELGVSLQQLLERGAQAFLASQSEDDGAEPSLKPISTKDIRDWLARLKYILESGNDLAILNCTATIRAMELWIEERKKKDAAIVQLPGSRLSA